MLITLSLLVLAQQSCTSDVNCGEARLCVAEPDEGPTCHATCPLPRAPAQRCTVLAPPDDETKPVHQRRFVWTHNRDALCKTCEQDNECGLMLDRCVQLINGERACMRDCTWNDECPKNFVCADPAGADGKVKRRQCVPVSGCCHCDVGFTQDTGGTVSSGGAGASSAATPTGGWQPKPPPSLNWGPPARWSGSTNPTTPSPSGGTTPAPTGKTPARPSTSFTQPTPPRPPPVRPQTD